MAVATFIITRLHISVWFSEEPTVISMFAVESWDQESLAQLSSWGKMEKGLEPPESAHLPVGTVMQTTIREACEHHLCFRM